MTAPPSGIEFALPESPGLKTAESLVAALRGADPAASVALDASAVALMSTPLVLALAAAVRSRDGGAPPIAVKNPTPAFMDAFSDLGLFGDLMKMEFSA